MSAFKLSLPEQSLLKWLIPSHLQQILALFSFFSPPPLVPLGFFPAPAELATYVVAVSSSFNWSFSWPGSCLDYRWAEWRWYWRHLPFLWHLMIWLFYLQVLELICLWFSLSNSHQKLVECGSGICIQIPQWVPQVLPHSLKQSVLQVLLCISFTYHMRVLHSNLTQSSFQSGGERCDFLSLFLLHLVEGLH